MKICKERWTYFPQRALQKEERRVTIRTQVDNKPHDVHVCEGLHCSDDTFSVLFMLNTNSMKTWGVMQDDTTLRKLTSDVKSYIFMLRIWFQSIKSLTLYSLIDKAVI